VPADHLGQFAGEQREIEEGPEPADEEHHFRSDEQDHPVTLVKLNHRRVIAGVCFAHDLGEPLEHAKQQDRHPGPRHNLATGHIVHLEYHAGGEGQRTDRADQRHDVGRQDVIFVILGTSHDRLPNKNPSEAGKTGPQSSAP
jgi:hypothetical protein